MPSSGVATSPDAILTGLAQLGILHTRTERAFISLFDAQYQYLVAEATPSTPLTPSVPSDSCSTPLVLCGHAIPRGQSACEHVLYAANDDQPFPCSDLPLSIVPDLRKDVRFSSRPYCTTGDTPQFYAAVPIQTNQRDQHRNLFRSKLESRHQMGRKLQSKATTDFPRCDGPSRNQSRNTCLPPPRASGKGLRVLC